jgi:hypothetical protein
VRFIVLGDLHYSVYNTSEIEAAREEYYEMLFQKVLDEKPDLVLAIGDTVDNGYPEEFEGLHACARRTGLSFYTVNGNHDLLNLTKDEIARWTGNRQRYYTVNQNSFSGEAASANGEAASFVVLDTPKEKSPKDHGGYVDGEQIMWLKHQIENSASHPLFVFGHHPLVNATRWATFPMLNIDNSKEVKLAFYHKQQGPAFYFCGHNHANSIIRRNNWTFVQTAAPLRTQDFRVVDFTESEVEIRTVELHGLRPRKLAKIQMKAMGDFLQLPAKGWPWDRHIRLKIEQPVFAGEKALSY